jgi:hypothetical protein
MVGHQDPAEQIRTVPDPSRARCAHDGEGGAPVDEHRLSIRGDEGDEVNAAGLAEATASQLGMFSLRVRQAVHGTSIAPRVVNYLRGGRIVV